MLCHLLSPTRTTSPISFISWVYRKPICCSPDTRESCSCFSSNSCWAATRALCRFALMCLRSSEPAWNAETTALTAATTCGRYSLSSQPMAIVYGLYRSDRDVPYLNPGHLVSCLYAPPTWRDRGGWLDRSPAPPGIPYASESSSRAHRLVNTNTHESLVRESRDPRFQRNS